MSACWLSSTQHQVFHTYSWLYPAYRWAFTYRIIVAYFFAGWFIWQLIWLLWSANPRGLGKCFSQVPKASRMPLKACKLPKSSCMPDPVKTHACRANSSRALYTSGVSPLFSQVVCPSTLTGHDAPVQSSAKRVYIEMRGSSGGGKCWEEGGCKTTIQVASLWASDS